MAYLDGLVPTALALGLEPRRRGNPAAHGDACHTAGAPAGVELGIAGRARPREAGIIWMAVNAAGFLGSCAIGVFERRRMSIRNFDLRAVAAFVLFFAFGILWSVGLGHITPRQLGVFWPTYFMMIYIIVGLWVGSVFVAIGLGITALTLIGYFFVGTWFDLWMAVCNGGGLLPGGLWMRRS
jgi:hypothetical protein